MKTEASEYLSLLQKIQNNNVSTFTVMPADEPRFTIETNSRNIIVPSEFSFLSVQNDHRAETIYFEIDRYFDNVDLSQHTCVVQFINKSGTTINEGTYPVTSMDIDSVDGKIVFGWEIRNDATQLTGDITFSVRFYSIDNNGNFTYNFNTLTASSYILPSLNIIASGERITATELEVWTDKMNNLASSIESDIITVEEKIEELENYIASIPEDYTALTEEVSQLSGEIVGIQEDLYTVGQNILNKNGELVNDRYLASWDVGESTYDTFWDSDGCITSPIMEIDNTVKEYAIVDQSGKIQGIGFMGQYDENGILLGGSNSGLVTILENCKYLRCTFNNQGQFNSIASIQPYEGKNDGYEIAYYGKKRKFVVESEVVKKEEGKGLSTNDFTNEYKNMLDEIKIPVIIWNFDMTSLDGRFDLMIQNGWSATWQVIAETDVEIIKKLVKSGQDLSLYSGYDNSKTVEEIKNGIQTIINKLESKGIYNTCMFSCAGHKTGDKLNEALSTLPFRYIRASVYEKEDGTIVYPSDLTMPNEKRQHVMALNNYRNVSFDTIKTNVIDKWVNEKRPMLMLMLHTYEYDNFEENKFKQIVEYVKQLENDGIVKVMNARQYFEYYYPKEGREDDRVRIMSNIMDLKNPIV